MRVQKVYVYLRCPGRKCWSWETWMCYAPSSVKLEMLLEELPLKLQVLALSNLNLRNTLSPTSEAWASLRGCCLAPLYCLPVISNLGQLDLLKKLK